MNDLFTDTDGLRAYVNINASFPFEKMAPYISGALNIVTGYIGDEKTAELADDPEGIEQLRRAVAPLAVMLSTHELSVNFGDAGHTVMGGKTLLPASDMKVSAYMEAVRDRGYNQLEELMAQYAIFTPSDFIATPAAVMELSGVYIRHPYLVYSLIRPAFADIIDMRIRSIVDDKTFTLLTASPLPDNLKPLYNSIGKYVAKASILGILADYKPVATAYHPETSPIAFGQMASVCEALLERIESQQIALQYAESVASRDPRCDKLFNF